MWDKILSKRWLPGITGVMMLFSGYSSAQVGNEWIKFNQTYFKIPAGKNGIYRLTYANLQNAGFPVSSVDPRRVQIFHRGVEQAIYVEGEADAKFDATDFIEFYGKRNDGTLDGELYKPLSLQPNKYYNLYSDTTSYFLTFSPTSAGKRMTFYSELNVTNIPKETYHFNESLLVLSDNYFSGISYSDYAQTSFFDQGEGWTGAEIRQPSFLDYTLTNLTDGVVAGGLPQLEILLVGRNLAPHQSTISVGPNAGALRVLTVRSFTAFSTTLISLPLSWSDIGSDGKLTIRISADGASGEPDRLSASYIKVRYPQSLNSAGVAEKQFNLQANPPKAYIEIQNPAAGIRLFDITDTQNVIKIGATSTTTVNAIIRNTSVPRSILATNVIITPSIKQIRFRQIVPSNNKYIIISHQLLMKPASGYANPVKEYGSYRASAQGGGYDTIIMDIQQVYDQFNYGETSSLGIFHFMKYMCATNTPKYLFIIGKGLTVDYAYYRNPNSFPTYKDLVPTAGIPGSDMYFSAGLSGTTYEPAVPTGRITASKPADVAAYLNKVKQMEALPYNDLWRKNILHLSGGIHDGEPEIFKNFMVDFQKIAENLHLGGKVKAIPKRSTNIELINVSDEVNKGLNLVTFFGHASPGTTDFQIGFVTDPILGYNNPNKYPTLLMNGCNVGAFFLNSILFGEDWVNAADKGAIGFIANSTYGFEGLLKEYSDMFYEVGYGDSTFIKLGLGDIQKEVAKRYINNNSSVYDVAQAQQMVLLGDPAVKLFGAKKADYEINSNNLFIESFDGAPVSINTDSFALKIIVRNFGQAKEDSLLVTLTRTFDDGSSATIYKIFPPTKYTDTLIFVLKKDGVKGLGNNMFTVKIDAENTIKELDESNNIATKGFFIPLNGTKNIFPFDCAIVNQTQLNLTLQATDLLSGEREFLVELDTTDSFNSGFKKQFTVKGTVLAKQVITILNKDSLAYYWRTKLAQPLPGENTDWTVTSFTYITNGPAGWAQVHFPQYLRDQSIGLVKDAAQRRFRFEETETDIAVKTFGSANATPYTETSIKIDNTEYNLYSQGGGCRNNTLNLIAFDKTSTVPYAGIPFSIVDQRSCGRNPQVIDNFVLSELETGTNDDLFQYIDNVITGDSVLLFSMGDAGLASWSTAVKNKLSDLGISSTQINMLLPGEPFVIFGKKGAPSGTAKIFRTSASPANQQTLQVNETITGRYTSGKMQSVRIGPALQWNTFTKRVTEKGPTDVYSFDIVGIKLNGSEQILYSSVTSDKDLSGIDASQYPYLKVLYKAEDDINLSATQLKKWIVTYEPVAEGLLIYKGVKEQEIISEGENWSSNYGFVNISNLAFTDSLTVHYELFNKTSRLPEIQDFKIKAPLPTDTTKFSIQTNSNGKSGLNDVTVFVNPHVVSELYYENNTLELPDHLSVTADNFNPVMEVTIDGRYIENGSIIPSNPTMVVKIWDENSIILKSDTVGINLFLKYPCTGNDCDFVRIKYSQADVKWYPATPTSDFRVEFNPQNLPEGNYTLKIESKDARGNLSGLDPYQITFKVQAGYDDSSVIILNPYPNPSNASFYFTFVVSGTNSPEDFRLEIIGINGKIVQEIYPLSPQDLHLGSNTITWDGKDAFGNDQPAGIYLYRLKIKTGAKEIRKNGKLGVIR